MTDLRYPLVWPDGWPRAKSRTSGPYQVSQDRALQDLHRTLRLMRAGHVVVSTNILIRKTDGLPRSGQRIPDDPGVALYFERKREQLCMACDRYDEVRSNIRAIGLALEGLRAVERAGVTELLDRAFQGFARLSSGSPRTRDFREVLDLDREWPDVLYAETFLAKHFREATAKAHPDRGGTDAAMREVIEAHETALRVLEEARSKI